MSRYFHVTPATNLDSILSQGLISSIGERSALIGESQQAIYLFTSSDAVIDACENWLGECFDDEIELALLAIESNETLLVNPGVEYEAVSHVSIDTSMITVLSQDLLAETEAALKFVMNQSKQFNGEKMIDKMSSLDVLRSYSSDVVVSELYEDDAFSGALNDLFPGTFEYPDFSHRQVGHVVGMVLKEFKEHESDNAALCGKFGVSVQLVGDVFKVDELGEAIPVEDLTKWFVGASGDRFSESLVRSIPLSLTSYEASARAVEAFGLNALAVDLETKIGGAKMKQQAVNDKYADSIIGDRADEYDALEVHGVRDLNALDDPDGTNYVIDDNNPQLFSVYAHVMAKGGLGGVGCVEAIGDFSERRMALEYADEMTEKYKWPARDFSKAEKSTNLDTEQSGDISRAKQSALYADSPLATAFLQTIIERSDPDNFHWTELLDADEFVEMYGNTPFEKTVFSLRKEDEVDVDFCPENATGYAVLAKQQGLEATLVMPYAIGAAKEVNTLTSQKSRNDAEAIAIERVVFQYANNSYLAVDKAIIGKVIGVTDEHVVLSLGRSAIIIAQSDLSRVPAMDEVATITVKDGKAMVADVQDKAIDKGR